MASAEQIVQWMAEAATYVDERVREELSVSISDPTYVGVAPRIQVMPMGLLMEAGKPGQTGGLRTQSGVLSWEALLAADHNVILERAKDAVEMLVSMRRDAGMG